MADVSPAENVQRKLPVRYQGLTLRFAVNVVFIFEQIFGLKIDDRYV